MRSVGATIHIYVALHTRSEMENTTSRSLARCLFLETRIKFSFNLECYSEAKRLFVDSGNIV